MSKDMGKVISLLWEGRSNTDDKGERNTFARAVWRSRNSGHRHEMARF